MQREFRQRMGMPVADNPTTPDRDAAELHVRLIGEETGELIGELFRDRIDLAKVAKESADVIYVVLDLCNRVGIDLGPVFAEVHRSNMTKDPSSKRADGKQLKGGCYELPDIAGVLRRQLEGATP